jgi:hypothetical protein
LTAVYCRISGVVGSEAISPSAPAG